MSVDRFNERFAQDHRMHSRRSVALVISFAVAALALACHEVTAPRDPETVRLSPQALVTRDSAAKVTLTYICGNKFRVRNPLGDSLLVHWDVYSTTDSGSIVLPAKQAGGSYSESFFTTRIRGTTRLFWQGNLIATKANGGAQCAATLSVGTNGGVVGLSDTVASYSTAISIPYSVSAAPGYTSVMVFVDSVRAPTSGSILMNRAHSVVAIGLTDTTAPQADPNLVSRLHALVESATPVESYRTFISDMTALSSQIGIDSLDLALTAATLNAFSVQDTAALRAFGAALNGQEFSVSVSADPVLTPVPTGDTIPYNYPFNLPSTAARVPTSRSATVVPRGNSFSPASVVFTGPVDPRPAEIVHINGWQTDVFHAFLNQIALKNLVRTSYLFPRAPTASVTYVYNDNNFSAYRANNQLACLNRVFPEAFQRAPSVLRSIARSSTCSDSLVTAFLFTGGDQVSQALLQLRDIIVGAPPSVINTSLANVIAKMENARLGRNHVLFVPHSQGNLYAIAALAAQQNVGRAPVDSNAACVGYVPTASPTSLGYPVGSPTLRPVQLPGDIILNWPTPGTYPKFPSTATALSDSVFAVQRSRVAYSTFQQVRYRVLAFEDSLFLHDFRRAYLAPNGAAEGVLSALVSVYSFCEPVLDVYGPQLPLSIGDQYRATISLTGANGSAMTPIAPVRWSTSDATIAAVDQAGNITAVGPGDALITVRYRGKTVSVTVTVLGPSPDDVILWSSPDFIDT
jgi:hypothetical protein